MLLVVGWSQKGDLTHGQAGTPNAAVDFGVLPTAPLGPPPCLQSGAIGGPADPCAYKLHHLTPEEVTVNKEGQVTFQVHGGGHGLAIMKSARTRLATVSDNFFVLVRIQLQLQIL